MPSTSRPLATLRCTTRWPIGCWTLAAVTPGPHTPEGVEVCERWQGDQRLVFALNHTAQPQAITLTGNYTDLASGAHLETDILTLPPRDVRVLLAD